MKNLATYLDEFLDSEENGNYFKDSKKKNIKDYVKENKKMRSEKEDFDYKKIKHKYSNDRHK